MLQSARVSGALGYSVEVTEAGKGMSRRMGDEQVVSGDVLRNSWCRWEKLRAQVSPAERAREVVDTRVGVYASGAPGGLPKAPVDVRDAQARGRRVAAQLLEWYTDGVGPSLVASCPAWRDGGCRSLRIAPKVEVPSIAAITNVVAE